MDESTGAPAGVAEVGAAPAAGTPGPVSRAMTLDDAVPQEYGVRFTSDHEPGADYEPCPPPAAEVQHQMGLHQDQGA